MIVYPAIDLKDGKCVRLYKGDMKAATVYNEDPLSQVKTFEEAGFSHLHLVDLNGAVERRSVNIGIVRELLKNSKMKVQLGGGIRDLDRIERWLSVGVDRIILGTVAVRNPDLVLEACGHFPGKIVVAIDARNGKVALSGWTENTDIEVTDLVKKFENAGVASVIYTDINRDGTGQGLNVDSTKLLASATSIPVIASGGVASLKDLELVRDAGLAGVIVGTAMYDGRLDLRQAAALSK